MPVASSRRHGGHGGEIATGRRAGNAEPVGVDAVFFGLALDPADADFHMGVHLLAGVLRDGSGADREDGVARAAIDVEHARPFVIVDLAAIGMEGAARHVDDGQAVAGPRRFRGERREHIGEQAGPVYLREDQVFVLDVRVSSACAVVRCGSRQRAAIRAIRRIMAYPRGWYGLETALW